MVGYDKQSLEGTMSDLTSIFSLPLTDVTSTQVKTVEYFPISAIDEKTRTLEFNLGSSDDYLDIASLLLSIKGKFVGVADSTKPATDANPKKFTCVNLLLHALIKKVEILVNNKPIVDLPYYGIGAYLNMLLNTNDSERKTSLKPQGLIPHTVGKSDNLTDALDGGLLERYELIKDSQTITLMGPLYSGLTMQRKFLIPGLNIRIKITLQESPFVTLENNVSPFYKFELIDTFIRVKHIEVGQQIKYTLEKRSIKDDFVYALPNYNAILRYIPMGAQAYTFENLGSIHSRCYVVFIDAKAVEGDRGLDPFKFENCNISSIKLSRGTEQYIFESLDFDKKEYGAVYMELLRCLGSGNVSITPQEFENESCIFPFNLSLSDQNSTLPARNENITRLHVGFKTPLTKQMCAIFFISNPKIMSITSTRKVEVR
jgi:hypothetical protein